MNLFETVIESWAVNRFVVKIVTAVEYGIERTIFPAVTTLPI